LAASPDLDTFSLYSIVQIDTPGEKPDETIRVLRRETRRTAQTLGSRDHL